MGFILTLYDTYSMFEIHGCCIHLEKWFPNKGCVVTGSPVPQEASAQLELKPLAASLSILWSMFFLKKLINNTFQLHCSLDRKENSIFILEL